VNCTDPKKQKSLAGIAGNPGPSSLMQTTNI
jgi:hypothetical protein